MFNMIKKIKKYNVLLVDLDNTLFNYDYAHKKALNYIFKKYDITNDDYEKAKIVLKTRDLKVNHHKKEAYFKIIQEFKEFSLINVLEIYNDYKEQFNKNLLIDKSMFELLKYFNENDKTVIGITNYYITPQLEKLKASNLIDYINYLITSEEFEVEKPHFSLIERAVELSKEHDLSKIVMIGDSEVDNFSNHYNIDYYSYNCNKLLISISGKSGAGKSTIAKEIQKIFNASIIKGDGYHKYDRYSKMWEKLTHYNPKANNLIQLGLDIKNLYHSIDIIKVPIYNHSTGKFDGYKEINPNEIHTVIIDGLHTLYKEVTGDYVKIKIYIDNEYADDQKIERDIKKRNKTKDEVLKSIEKREDDYNKYILIQKQYSNFIINIRDNKFEIIVKDDLILSDKYDKDGDRYIIQGNYNELIKTMKDIMIDLKNNRYIKG